MSTTAATPRSARALARDRRRQAWSRNWRTFRSHRAGLIGLGILAGFALVAILAPVIAPTEGLEVTKATGGVLEPPSSEYWLGTDDKGRSVLTLLIWGARVSLFVGLLATLISMVIGTVMGLVSGYFGGIIGAITFRVTEWFLVIPFLPLAIVLVSLLEQRAADWPGGKLGIIIIVIGITGWAGTSRIIRSQVLSTKERTFVERSRALGAGTPWVLRKQILPNVLPLIRPVFTPSPVLVTVAVPPARTAMPFTLLARIFPALLMLVSPAASIATAFAAVASIRPALPVTLIFVPKMPATPPVMMPPLRLLIVAAVPSLAKIPMPTVASILPALTTST